jgi:ribosomal subunit interface protein
MQGAAAAKVQEATMNIDVRSMGFETTPAIETFVHERARLALAAFAHSVVTATVRLDDVNASRGGVDKRCRIVGALRGRGTVACEATHEDLYGAIDQAAGRMRRVVQRQLKKHVARERREAQPWGTPAFG